MYSTTQAVNPMLMTNTMEGTSLKPSVELMGITVKAGQIA